MVRFMERGQATLPNLQFSWLELFTRDRAVILLLQNQSYYFTSDVLCTSSVCFRLFCYLQRFQIFSRSDPLQPALIEQHLIHRRPPSGINTRGRNAERSGFAIDSAARTDDEVACG